MPLTRAWAIILAFLATAFLAGMFLLSSNSGRGFTDADKAAVRAITEAGIAALEAQLQSSPVQQIQSLARDPRLKSALEAKRDPRDPDAFDARLYATTSQVAEEARVSTRSNMTVALVDSAGTIVVSSGAAEKDLPALIASSAFQNAATDADLLLSISLGNTLHVAQILRPDAAGRRWIAVEPLPIGAGSLVRRVLGSNNPAGLIHDGQLLGELIGNQPVTAELVRLDKEHRAEVPREGASKVFVVGEGMDARLGSLGRIPGPAGEGEDGAMLGVLSASTAAAGYRDMAGLLSEAQEQGDAELPWALLLGLLLVSGGLAFYLPGLEGLTPMRRLGREFNAIAQGTQHSIFHDRYSGTAGEVARAAAGAHEALRQAYLAELEIDEVDDAELSGSGRSRSRTGRNRRPTTRSNRRVSESSPRRTTGRARVVSEHDSAASGPRDAPRNPFSDSSASSIEPLVPPSAIPTVMPPPISSSSVGPHPDKTQYYRGIYDEFLRVKAQCGEPTDRLSFEKFSQRLIKNTTDIKTRRPDVKDVEFSVYVKEGKAALRAKVVKA